MKVRMIDMVPPSMGAPWRTRVRVAFHFVLRYFDDMRVPAYVMIALVFAMSASAQVKQRRSELNRLVPPASHLTEMQQKKASEAFDLVQSALSEVSSSAVARLFNRSVYLALPGIEPGQFSRDQAAQLLAAFLRPVGAISVEIKKKEDSLASPYLSAQLLVRRDDQEQLMNLYVSLVRNGDAWAIGHFSIY